MDLNFIALRGGIKMETKGKVRINPKKEFLKKEITDFEKAKTQAEKIDLIAKKLGLI